MTKSSKAAALIASLIILACASIAFAQNEYTYQAITAEAAGKNDEALALYAKAIAASPKEWGNYQFRGSIYDYQRKYDLATADFTRLIKLDPKGKRSDADLSNVSPAPLLDGRSSVRGTHGCRDFF